MIVSTCPPTSSTRWLRACVLLCAGLLPLGVVQAQEPDYEAVGDRLLEAVEDGELSPEQAKAMMGALASQRFAERLAGEEAEGDDEDEEWEELAEHYEELGLPHDRFKGMVDRMLEAGIDDEQLQETLWVMVKLVHAIRDDDLEPDHAREFEQHLLKEVELSGEQIDLVWGMAKRLAAHGRKQGPSRDDMGAVKEKIWAAVKAGRISEQEAKQRWEAYLEKVRGGEQGIVGHFKTLGVDEGVLGRIKDALREGGVKGEQLERTFGGMLRLVHAFRSSDDPAEALRGIKGYFEGEVGLNAKQIELAVGLSRRLAASQKRDEEPNYKWSTQGRSARD